MILPKVLRFSRLLEGATKSGWFQALNISYRNSRLMSFAEFEVFEDPQVPVVAAGPAQNASSGITESSGLLTRGQLKALKSQKATLGSGESPFAVRMLLSRLPSPIRSGRADASSRADVRSCQRHGRIVGKAALEECNPPNPPTAQNQIGSAGKTVTELLAAPERKFVVIAHHEPMGSVIGGGPLGRGPLVSRIGPERPWLPVSIPCPKTSTSYNSPTWRTRRSGVSPL